MTEPHRGFYVIEEEAIRHLKRTFGDPASYRKASAAYHTLIRIANLKASQKFEERIGALADDMGYGYCEAHKALKLVAMAGLCDVEARTIPGTKERDKSLYTVKRRLSDFNITLPEKEGRLSGGASRSTFTESTQEPPQKPKKNHPKREVLRTAPSFDELLSFLQSLPSPDPKGDAEHYVLHWKENGFTNGGKPVRNWKLTLSKWHKAGWLPSQKRANGTSIAKPQERTYAPVEDSWTTK